MKLWPEHSRENSVLSAGFYSVLFWNVLFQEEFTNYEANDPWVQSSIVTLDTMLTTFKVSCQPVLSGSFLLKNNNTVINSWLTAFWKRSENPKRSNRMLFNQTKQDTTLMLFNQTKQDTICKCLMEYSSSKLLTTEILKRQKTNHLAAASWVLPDGCVRACGTIMMSLACQSRTCPSGSTQLAVICLLLCF